MRAVDIISSYSYNNFKYEFIYDGCSIMSVHVIKLPGNIWEKYKNGKATVYACSGCDASVMREGDTILFRRLPYLEGAHYAKIRKIVRFDKFAELFGAYKPSDFGEDEGEESSKTAAELAEQAEKRFCQDGNEYICAAAIELTKEDAALTPQTVRARRINDRDIEIYWDEMFEDGEDPGAEAFSVFVDGKELALERRYGHGGRVYFYGMTTLRLAESLPCGEGAPDVTVKYADVEVTAPYEDYYKYRFITKSGIEVKGSAALLLGMETVKRAGEIVDIMLSTSPEIAAQMVKSGASLCVYGKGECAFHIPEHRSGYNPRSLYVEGFGGITCSITEANVWHWRDGDDSRPDKEYSTRYRNECILVHEFGHGVKIAGIDRMENDELARELRMLYRHAKAAGLWPNTYAISNSDEYFATLSAIWFNVMNECAKDDGWDGTRGPINTRRELYNYDIDAYKFFSKIYPYRNLDGAWALVPDTVKVTGLKDDPEEDFTGRNFKFPYPPVQEAATAELKEGEPYKIALPRGGFVADTGATETALGLWHDYSASGVDCGAMTFYFEFEGDVTERFDGGRDGDERELTYMARIRGKRDGYLAVDVDKNAVYTVGDNKEAAYIFKIAVTDGGFAVITAGEHTIAFDGKPENGTPLILRTSDDGRKYMRGGVWRLVNMAEEAKKVLFIHDGTANGSPLGAVAVAGDKIELEAAEQNGAGGKFSHWRTSCGTLLDEKSPKTIFTMPDSDAVVWAIYE